ncbi:MAG: HAMP domain-containing histidine kinase [Lachnospiraceae bacterium]|nr:HAMP domain-containing histidine kinase [Lachnospiraceae bacterium]
MAVWLWAFTGILAVIVIILLIKIRMLQKAAGEIGCAFAERLMTDSNTLIGISTRDRQMRRLADDINRELRKLRAQRQRFQQGDMELKDAVTNMSHDIRTPLTAICGYLDLLEGEEVSEDARRYLAIIRERAGILAVLTEELFQYSVISSEKGAGAREEVVLDRALEEGIASFYASLAERGITPVIRMPQESVVRALDASALARVISNLLHNAIKYSDGDLEVTLKESGEIIFSNTASSLDKVQVGRLFDRFYTVEAARNSTGLGLSIARTLTEQMGGTISAEYERGRLSVNISFQAAESEAVYGK